MRDMSKVYQNLSLEQLQTRRSKAVVERDREAQGKARFNDREVRVLNHIIHQIDVEITCRMQQRPLPLVF